MPKRGGSFVARVAGTAHLRGRAASVVVAGGADGKTPQTRAREVDGECRNGHWGPIWRTSGTLKKRAYRARRLNTTIQPTGHFERLEWSSENVFSALAHPSEAAADPVRVRPSERRERFSALAHPSEAAADPVEVRWRPSERRPQRRTGAEPARHLCRPARRVAAFPGGPPRPRSGGSSPCRNAEPDAEPVRRWHHPARRSGPWSVAKRCGPEAPPLGGLNGPTWGASRQNRFVAVRAPICRHEG